MIVFLLWIFTIIPQINPIVLTDNAVDLNKYEYLIVQEDIDISEAINSKEFILLDNELKNFGINSDLMWLKYDIINKSQESTKYFYINNSSLDSLELYVVEGSNIIGTYSGGRLVDYKSKPIPSKSIIFKLELPQNVPISIYLQINSVNKKIITATVSDLSFIDLLINRENILFGIFTGVLVGLFFYNLFLYFSVRDKIYLIYVIHTALVWFAQSSILGYTQEIFWQDSVWLNLRSGVIFSSLVSVVGIWFLRVFLSTNSFTPKLDKGFYFI